MPDTMNDHLDRANSILAELGKCLPAAEVQSSGVLAVAEALMAIACAIRDRFPATREVEQPHG